MNAPSRTGLRSTIGARFLAFALMAAVLWCAAPAESAEPPTFRLKDLGGEWFNLNDHLSEDVMYISFWATYCSPCRRELPHLQKMYEELGDQGFLVVSINTDPPSSKSKLKPFVKRHKFSFPVVLDPDNNVHEKYNPTRELPFAVLVDRSGNIVKTYAGYRSGDEVFLKQEVEKLLAVGQTDAQE